MRRLFLLLITIHFLQAAGAQDTLPNFSVKNLGNGRIVVGWVNNFDSLAQLSIQRSHDSLKNYGTVISLTDPNARTNGFADNAAPNDHMYYRLFVLKKGGYYFFTAVKRPVFDTTKALPPPEPVVIKRVEPKRTDFVPSFNVYTNKDGYVYINLPDADRQKYHLKFYEADGSLLFEIKQVKQTGLTLDKTNFQHAGWFLFDLYNDEKLVEKHKFYLAKEF